MTILEKVRKLNWVLQESSSGLFSFNDLSQILGEVTNSNVYLLNRRGKVLGVHYQKPEDRTSALVEESGAELFPNEYNEALLAVTETEANITDDVARELFKYDQATSGKMHTIVPIVNESRRLGTILLVRYSPAYSDEDLVLAEYGATVIGLEIRRRNLLEEEQETRARENVRMAIETLSYSEHKAVSEIFRELGETDGLLVASKVADRSGITRSVIVNALRKLESAGVIETRSLGMKGTHIRILNKYLLGELNDSI